eukprot:10965952-Ditylum_brightwellii.AAC.1
MKSRSLDKNFPIVSNNFPTVLQLMQLLPLPCHTKKLEKNLRSYAVSHNLLECDGNKIFVRKSDEI